MLFSEYVRILKNHFKTSVGNYELCNILFDFVIIPADLRNTKDPSSYITISEGTTSKILSDSAPIHTQIRDHIFDDAVIDKLVKNFESDIVTELNPETEDLCFQMMEIIRKDNISPSHKADFEMLAHPETIAPFLAKVFVYAISTNGSSGKIEEESPSPSGNSISRESILAIAGIKDNRISDKAYEELLLSKSDLSAKKLLDGIKSLFTKASNIHLQETTISTNPLGLKFALYEKYSVKDKTKELFDNVAKSLEIELPDDFYDFGNLYINPIGGVNSMGLPASTVNGSKEEKLKYQLFDKIDDAISGFLKVAPYIQAFENTKFISLALTNNGTTYDEDVRITLHFDDNVLLTVEDISKFDTEALDYLLDDCDTDKQFGIQKGIDFMDYSESENLKPHPVSIPRSSYPFPIQSHEIDYEEELSNLLGYFSVKDDSGYIVEVTIDKINQHTAVAFPSVILIKENVKQIPYSIKSKHQSDIISGYIDVDVFIDSSEI